MILKTWKLESLDKLIVTANAAPPPNFAALLPAVLAAANAGDPAASDVLAQAGSELAGRAIAVTCRLFRTASGLPVALSGGVLQHAARARRHVHTTSCPVSTTASGSTFDPGKSFWKSRSTLLATRRALGSVSNDARSSSCSGV